MFEIYLSRLRYNYNNFEHIENWNHSHIVIISRFIIQRNITFQSFNRTVDGSFISRSLLTRELKRASKEYPVVGERARPYICNYSFCCRKARCRLSLSVLHGLYTGQRFQTIQFLRAYTYSSSVSFPSNSPTSISLLSRKLWRRLEYIFRFSVVSELRRNENVTAIRKIQSGWPVPFHARNSLSLSLSSFSGIFERFSLEAAINLAARNPRPCVCTITLSLPTLCKFLATDYGNVIETQLEISILPRVKTNYFEFLSWIDIFFFNFEKVWIRVCEARNEIIEWIYVWYVDEDVKFIICEVQNNWDDSFQKNSKFLQFNNILFDTDWS